MHPRLPELTVYLVEHRSALAPAANEVPSALRRMGRHAAQIREAGVELQAAHGA
jgi:hypothetical protein